MLIQLAVTVLWALALAIACAALYYRGLARRYQRALRRARRHHVHRVSQTLVQAEIMIGPALVRTDMVVCTPLLESLANGLGRTLVPISTTSVH